MSDFQIVPGSENASIEEQDALGLEQLAARGHDPAQPVDLAHYCYVPDERGALDLARRLATDRDYTVTLAPPLGRLDDGTAMNAWLVYAWKHEIVDASALRRTREHFSELARDVDGTYDGWEIGPARFLTRRQKLRRLANRAFAFFRAGNRARPRR